MQRALIIIGILIVVAGAVWPWLARLPWSNFPWPNFPWSGFQWGRLPGDIVIDRPGARFYFPIVTCIIVSVVVSLLLRLFRR